MLVGNTHDTFKSYPFFIQLNAHCWGSKIMCQTRGDVLRGTNKSRRSIWVFVGSFCFCKYSLLAYIFFYFCWHPQIFHLGLLNPLDCTHHMRADDLSLPYREGVVLEKPVKAGRGPLCDVGLEKVITSCSPCKTRLRMLYAILLFTAVIHHFCH